jgi:hypothetical protein
LNPSQSRAKRIFCPWYAINVKTEGTHINTMGILASFAACKGTIVNRMAKQQTKQLFISPAMQNSQGRVNIADWNGNVFLHATATSLLGVMLVTSAVKNQPLSMISYSSSANTNNLQR